MTRRIIERAGAYFSRALINSSRHRRLTIPADSQLKWLFAVGLGGVMVGGYSSTATADSWPTWRQSDERTAVAHGQFASSEPQVGFQLYLGGDLTAAAVDFPSELPGVVLASVGGRVRASNALSGALLWESPMLQELGLSGTADLDGDGSPEVVVFNRRQAFVLSSTTGEVTWASTFGQHSTISVVRITDLTGDGLPDLLIDDCASCGLSAPLVGEAITFASGEGETLWPIEDAQVPHPYHQGSDAVLRGLGDGRTMVGLSTVDDYRLVDGATGQLLAVVDEDSYPTGYFRQMAALVTDPERMLLVRVAGAGTVAEGDAPAIDSINLDFERGQGRLRWNYFAEPYSKLDVPGNAVVDLDGDASRELVFSERDPSDMWSLVVLDLDTGVVRQRIAGLHLEGVLQLNGPVLLLQATDGLYAARYEQGAVVPMSEPLTGGFVGLSVSSDPLLVYPLLQRLGHVSDGPNVTHVLVGHALGTSGVLMSQYDEVALVKLTAAGWGQGSSFRPEQPITAVVQADRATRPYQQFAVTLKDGSLIVLDRHMRATNGATLRPEHSSQWWSCDKTEYGGTFLGGRQPARANLIGRVDDRPFVVVPNGIAGTSVLDARSAGQVQGPETLWSSSTLTKPSVLSHNGSVVVAGGEDQTLVLRDAATGTLKASVALGLGALPSLERILTEPLLLERDGKSPVIAFDWELPRQQLVQRGIEWMDEGVRELWTSETRTFGGGIYSSAGRYTFDGGSTTADVLFSNNGRSTLARSADDGSLSTAEVYEGHYALPMIADMDAMPGNEILFQSGIYSPTILAQNWTPMWSWSVPQTTYGMAGALVPCADGVRYVNPFVRSPRFVLYEAATGTIVADLVAADGQLFASEAAATSAGHRPGFLSNISALRSAEGQVLVLFGSTDGFLYAIDGCSAGQLVWSKDFGSPLGEPSIGDWDNDGDEEILVGASSGHLIGIDFGRVEAPRVSVNHLAHRRAQVSWTPVEGASSYEVALLDPNNHPVWAPALRTVSGNHTTVNLDNALAGRPFRVAVRASAGASGPGVDGYSAPISLSDVRPPHVKAGLGPHPQRVWIAASDNQALDHYLLYAMDANGKRTLLDDGFLSGRFDQISIPIDVWSDPSAIPASLAVVAVDAVGNRSEVRVSCARHRR